LIVNDPENKLELLHYHDDGDLGGSAVQNKFVLLTHGDIIVMLMGPVDSFPYHATLVERYCRDNEIPACWVHKPDLLEIFDRDVEVRGGGQLDIFPEDGILKIYGFSSAYGPCNSEYLKKFISGHSFFASFSVRVKLI
jgi:hypothetical protein